MDRVNIVHRNITSKIQQIIAEIAELSDEDIALLMTAIQQRESMIRQRELVEYARQAAVDLRNGKLKPQSVAEIIQYLREEMEIEDNAPSQASVKSFK
jgi:hypothetical protein